VKLSIRNCGWEFEIGSGAGLQSHKTNGRANNAAGECASGKMAGIKD
jgi:hypothetical protein